MIVKKINAETLAPTVDIDQMIPKIFFFPDKAWYRFHKPLLCVLLSFLGLDIHVTEVLYFFASDTNALMKKPSYWSAFAIEDKSIFHHDSSCLWESISF